MLTPGLYIPRDVLRAVATQGRRNLSITSLVTLVNAYIQVYVGLTFPVARALLHLNITKALYPTGTCGLLSVPVYRTLEIEAHRIHRVDITCVNCNNGYLR